MKDRFLLKEINPYWGTSNYLFEDEITANKEFDELAKKYYNSKLYLMDLETEAVIRKRIT